MSNLTRRRFLEDSLLATAAAAAAAAPKSLVADEPTSVGANDRITAAIIGCGIRGKQHARELARLADCEIAYVCDPDRDRAAEVAAQLVEQGRPAPKAVQDLRTVLDGKDVYVAKPVSHNVCEGRRIVQVARKLGRICQGGTQNRSSGPWIEAIRHI